MRGQVLTTSNKDILNNELNLASCDSQIHGGLTYYYYKIDANNKYLSLITPDEMKMRNSNHQYLGGKNVFKSLYFTKSPKI